MSAPPIFLFHTYLSNSRRPFRLLICSSCRPHRPRDRRDLLQQKKVLLQRLHTIVSHEEMLAGVPSYRSELSSVRSDYPPSTARSARSATSVRSDASAATFRYEGPLIPGTEFNAGRVPPLRLR